jgi:hypothetical protein
VADIRLSATYINNEIRQDRGTLIPRRTSFMKLDDMAVHGERPRQTPNVPVRSFGSRVAVRPL